MIEEDIKRVFQKVELENNINNIAKWIGNLPSVIALTQKKNK